MLDHLHDPKPSIEPIIEPRIAKSPEPHVHEFSIRVPKRERTDRLTFCCTMYRCECGETITY